MTSYMGALYLSTHSLLQPNTAALGRQRTIWQVSCTSACFLKTNKYERQSNASLPPDLLVSSALKMTS